MRLAIVFDKEGDDIPHEYVEFSAEEFERVLLEEYSKVGQVKRAFERTCHALRIKAGEI